MSSNTYDFTLAAAVGATQYLAVAGTRVLILVASGGQVEVTTNKGDKFKLYEGQGFDSNDTNGFDWVQVRNLQAIANVGQVFIGDEFFIDRRITGTVQVIDGERSKVASGVCFTGIGDVVGAASGPRMQLWNSGGKNVFVNNIRMSASLADAWGIITTSNALPTITGFACANNDTTGPNSTAAVLRSDNTGAAWTGARQFKIGFFPAYSETVINCPRPIMVRPNTGLVLFMNSVTNNMRCSFEFEEWPL